MSFLRYLAEEVREMAQKLESSGEDMKNASRCLENTDATQVGTQRLASSCDNFSSSWDYGFGKLSELTQGVSEFAEDCMCSFEELDKDLDQQLREGSAG